ncbi:helix-turn-helix transcriptional regulator [Rickettsiales bacterium LUAb2]
MDNYSNLVDNCNKLHDKHISESIICNRVAAKFIKTLCINNNISYQDLINKTGITLQEKELADLEDGNTELDANNFYKIMNYFNVNIDRFFILSSIFIELFSKL